MESTSHEVPRIEPCVAPGGGVRVVAVAFSAMSWTRTVEPSRLVLCVDGLWVGFWASVVTRWAFFLLR